MEKKTKSTLNISTRTKQLPSVSKDSVARFKKRRKKKYSIQDYTKGIFEGNLIILSQAITVTESSLPDHQIIAQKIIEKCLPRSGNSVRVGITGVPGVGKSTFIEALGRYITGLGKKLAVLAIDPSSERSKGSIMGDKTRMEKLAADPNAFIRPSPTAGSLGGVARKTRETIILCEAAGFDTIFIETVGVGQSETAVHSMVDFFLLLILAGAGDELQGIKRGIMEMADAIVITKADGSNMDKAIKARNEFRNALFLFPPSKSGWIPNILTCSAFNLSGIDAIWDTINEYCTLTKNNLYFQKKRKEQARYWMYQAIDEFLRNHFYDHSDIKEKLPEIEKEVLERNLNPFIAAKKLLEGYFGKYGGKR
jgi:LAO/AO transport system kinase